MKSRATLFINILIIWLISGCGAYSFTGANIAPEIKTISVDFFQNRSNGGPAGLSQQFTDELKDKFVNETTLKLINGEGDIQFSGDITQYIISSQAPTANESSAVNKLSISVKVVFINTTNTDENWEQSFTKEARFPSTEELATLEESLISEINVELIDDIFNKALVKW